MSESEKDKSGPSAQGKMIRTVGFLAVVGVVLGVFVFLSTRDAPPDLPKDKTHSFRFDVQQRLIGLKSDPPDDRTKVEGVEYDLKSVEKRINTTCKSCHGVYPQIDPVPRKCEQMNAPCLPANHPPKETCIKCHRVGG